MERSIEHRQLGIDLSVLNCKAQISVLLEGRDLTGVEHMSCVVRTDDTDWTNYPVAREDNPFGEDGTFLLEAPRDCQVTVEELEILKLQKLVEDAGYQWQEQSKPGPSGEGREYLVAVTRTAMQVWTHVTPNVVAWGFRTNRLSCWKEAAVHAVMAPAVGSARYRRDHAPAQSA